MQFHITIVKVKAVSLNQKPLTNKTGGVFGNQDLTNYLSSTNNMVEYKNSCQYFYRYLVQIAQSFFINELKNVFNVIFPQFLKNNKKYN